MSIDYIPYIDLAAQWSKERHELLPLIEKTLASGHYVGGKDVEELETEMSEYFNVKYVVGVNSGTDALILSLKALGIQSGDEVIIFSPYWVSFPDFVTVTGMGWVALLTLS